jgi:cytochrome bd-type quinol oxidase subunit 2
MKNAAKTPLPDARHGLSLVWFTGAGIAFGAVMLQSIMGHYGDSLQEVWSWFTPTVFPTSALMLGVIGAAALQSDEDQRKVKVFFYKLSRYLAVFYLSVLLLTVLLEPFSKMEAIKLYSVSSYWLSPLQGLVVAAITVLFTSQEGAQPPKAESARPADRPASN